MALYHAALHGTYQGQSIVNNLYYRTGIGFDLDGLSIGGAKELADCIKGQVWNKMKPCLPVGYTLERIDVYPYHDGTFDLLYQNPWTLNVLENGTEPDSTDGPATVCIIKFNLEPTQIFANGIMPPKRGYVAVGPVVSGWIDNDGNLTQTAFIGAAARFQELATALAANLENLLPPVVFFPIRMKTLNILGVYKPASWADVGGAVLRRRTSFRRSRMTGG